MQAFGNHFGSSFEVLVLTGCPDDAVCSRFRHRPAALTYTAYTQVHRIVREQHQGVAFLVDRESFFRDVGPRISRIQTSSSVTTCLERPDTRLVKHMQPSFCRCRSQISRSFAAVIRQLPTQLGRALAMSFGAKTASLASGRGIYICIFYLADGSSPCLEDLTV